MKYIAELARKCLHDHPRERPTMAQVVESLEIALVSYERMVTSRGSIAKGMRTWRDGGGPSKHSSLIQLLDKLTQSAYPRFSLAEIRTATNDFNAGFSIDRGRLYSGCNLGGNHVVAIQRYQLRTGLDFEERVCAEIQVQFLIHHPNIVSNLVGFCVEEHELIFVYNSVSNGTLKSHLYETNIQWKKRLEICIDIARGIEFLHTNVQQQVIHSDIRTSNIFWDDKWVAKIGGFQHVIPIPNGLATRGLKTVTKESDVYSFGVVLLEVLCKKPMNELGWLYKLLGKGTIDKAIDPYLIGKIAPKCFTFFVCLALSCVADMGIRCPSMDNVLRCLQSLLQLQDAWDNSMEMGELHVVDFPRSYNQCIPVASEFTIGGQRFNICELVLQHSSSWEKNL